MSLNRWSWGPSVRDNYEVALEGYSRLSLSSALHRYISLPIVFNQLAQLVLGGGGDSLTVKITGLL